jgi:hypothetical protein
MYASHMYKASKLCRCLPQVLACVCLHTLYNMMWFNHLSCTDLLTAIR